MPLSKKLVEMIVRLDDHCRFLTCTYFSMPLPASQCNSDVCVAGGAIANGKDLDSHLNKDAAAVNCKSSVLPPSPGHLDIY